MHKVKHSEASAILAFLGEIRIQRSIVVHSHSTPIDIRAYCQHVTVCASLIDDESGPISKPLVFTKRIWHFVFRMD